MAYIVQDADNLYSAAGTGTSTADDVGKFLSETEAQGYRLVGILPDHQMFDEAGKPAGKAPAKLILFKEGDA